MVVAIDGPSGSGKSTVARAVAQRLGFAYLDTGAMYRGVALIAKEREISPLDAAREMQFSLVNGELKCNGRKLDAAIRTPEISQLTSQISTNPEVREVIVAHQRQLLSESDFVGEGRDIGTVVATDASVKIFLDASEEERARRRAAELGDDIKQVLIDQRERDQRDRTRSISPLLPAKDATVIDTTDLTIEQVVDQIVDLVNQVRGR